MVQLAVKPRLGHRKDQLHREGIGLGQKGRVLVDRYHAHILKTPTEVRAARFYLLHNAEEHYGRKGADPYISRAPVMAPRTWLGARALL